MKVRALKSFGGVGKTGGYHHPAGSEFDLPDGVDWLRAGLVEAIEPPENAAMPTPKKRQTEPEPVTAIKGIGPATADELAELGVHTVADLAAAELTADYTRFQETARERLR